MAISTLIAIYFLIWWIVLFAILPWGISSQAEAGDVAPGTDPGAPSLPRLMRKAIWTTIVATTIFAAFYYGYSTGRLTLDGMAELMGLKNLP